MSRLISTGELHNVVMKRKREYGRLATLVDNIVEEMVGETLTADAIFVPKGITNGDMIKIMFSNVEIDIVNNTVLTDIDNGCWFSLDWWNTPYKKEV